MIFLLRDFFLGFFGRRKNALLEDAADIIRPDVKEPTSVRAAKNIFPPIRSEFGPRITLFYADAHGECTQRTVRLYAIPRTDAKSFRAHCELRNAQRTFKISNIQWIIGDNGAKIEAKQHFNELRAARTPRKEVTSKNDSKSSER